MCKKPYASRSDARKTLNHLRAKSGRGGATRREQNVYRCDYCGAWHLTSWVAP